MDMVRMGSFLAELRKEHKLTQAELGEKLGVTNKTVSRWENGLSVPDSGMLILLADELDTSVSTLLGEAVKESDANELKAISEKLEIINLQLANRSKSRRKIIRWLLILLCVIIVMIFIALVVMQSCYLGWDYSNPELAVTGTMLHGFEYFYVRLAPMAFTTSLIGIVFNYKKL